jgi:hypothetical protein
MICMAEAQLDTTVRSRRQAVRLQSCTTYQAGHSYGQSNTQPSCILMVSPGHVCVLVVTWTCIMCVTANAMCLLATLCPNTSQMPTVGLHVSEATGAIPQKTLAYGTTVLGQIWAAVLEHEIGDLSCCSQSNRSVSKHGLVQLPSGCEAKRYIY